MSSVERKTGTEDKMSLYEGMVEDLANADENSRYILDDLQLAAELGKTLLERNKELETLLRTHQRKCEDQRQEIEYLTKQNITLREVNASRLQIYETLDTSIQDLEYEKHRLLVENSGDKKLIKNLNQTIESLELRCDDLTKQVDEMGRYLDQERRKNEKILENSTTAPVALSTTKQPQSLRHRSDGSGSASEPESEEASTTPTNPSKIFSSDSSSIHTSSQLVQMTFLNYSHDLSSIQPIYSIDSSSHDSGFKTGSCSNSAEHEELLKVITELEETKQQFMNEHMTVAELEQQLSVLAQENQKLQSKLVQSNTLDEMRSVHEELSFLEEVRQGQMCTRCLKTFDDRMVPTENTSYIGTEGDDDDRSLMDLLNHATTQDSPPTYRSAVTIKPTSCPLCTKFPLAKKLHELPASLSFLSLISFELWLHFEKLSYIRWIIKLLQWPALVMFRLVDLDNITYDNIRFM